MLSTLNLWNFSSGVFTGQELAGNAFVLRTCQRTVVVAFDGHPFKVSSLPEATLFQGKDAYLFLLETICGLKSKLIGENEIVGQFKEAYKSYASSPLKDTKLLQVLEKLFKDAKDIRTQYLIGISQKTYASLTRRHLIQKARAPHIVVVGSGALAEDLINQFKKKASVSLCARNTEKVEELAKLHSLEVIPWEELSSLENSAYIANTVGTDAILFDETFFKNWATKNENRLFVDLGSPSSIQTDLTLNDGVVRLENIFDEGAVVEAKKREQIALAKAHMVSLTIRRDALFTQKFNKSIELFSPQSAQDVRYI